MFTQYKTPVMLAHCQCATGINLTGPCLCYSKRWRPFIGENVQVNRAQTTLKHHAKPTRVKALQRNKNYVRTIAGNMCRIAGEVHEYRFLILIFFIYHLLACLSSTQHKKRTPLIKGQIFAFVQCTVFELARSEHLAFGMVSSDQDSNRTYLDTTSQSLIMTKQPCLGCTLGIQIFVVKVILGGLQTAKLQGMANWCRPHE